MRVLSSVVLLSTLSLVAAGPHGGPHGGSHDGSLARPPKHVRGSGSGDFAGHPWDGSGSFQGKKPHKKHGCHYPPRDGSFPGSFDGSRGRRADGSHGSHHGGPHGRHPGHHGPRNSSFDGSHDRPMFDCDNSTSTGDDADSVGSVLSTSSAMAVAKVGFSAATALAATAMYLFI